MIKIIKYEDLGHADHGWLNARHHFSFASYNNPERMGFGALQVINDDIVAANSGFPTHPHQNMEIITYVRKGAITHKDSQGNEGRTEAGDVQVMSAGTGVTHSEYNHEDEAVQLYQIWIHSDKAGHKPRWDQTKFPKGFVNNELRLLVSGDEKDSEKGSLFIYQDAQIYGGTVKASSEINHPIKSQSYVLASKGKFKLNDEFELSEGDGAEITDLNSIKITAIEDSEILVIDVPE